MTHWIWEGSPILLDLGVLKLRWYGLLFAGGFFLGFQFIKKAYLREGRPQADVDILLRYAIIGTLLGARLVHCFFYDPSYYLSEPWKILFIWQGGLASHGGYIGAFIAVWVFQKTRKRQPFLWILDRMAVAGALAGSMIRIGNFFNSEILGTPTDLPWAIIFARYSPLPRHPTQLYEALGYFCVFLILRGVYAKQGAKTPQGFLLGLAFVLMALVRFVLEFTKINQAAFTQHWLINMGQWLTVPFFFLGFALMAYSKRSSRDAKLIR